MSLLNSNGAISRFFKKTGLLLSIIVLCLTFGITYTSAETLAPDPPSSPSAPFCDAVTTITRSDCDTLVFFYTQTSGASWTTSTGWLTDSDPCMWHGVTCAGNRVRFLELPLNNLMGSIPAETANLTDLRYLLLNNNQLNGNIPLELGSFPTLEILRLQDNSLSGSIPADLADIPTLQQLDLTRNDLTGIIPQALGNIATLNQLYLNANGLTGTIPASLGNPPNLTILDLANNQLTGSIPASLSNTALTQLYLSGNQLTGSLPAALGLLPLVNVRLHDNALSGVIPRELMVPTLNLLYLHNNDLSGPIPTTISNTVLTQLQLSNNRLGGTLPPAIGALNLTSLSIGANKFEGKIPDTFEALTNLSSCEFALNMLEVVSAETPNFLSQCTGATSQTIPPTDLTIIQLSSTSVRLNWTPIAYTGFTEGGTYVIELSSVFGSSSQSFTINDRSVNSFTFTGLTPLDPYKINIRTETPAHSTQTNSLTSRAETIGAATDIDLLSIFALAMDSDLDRYYNQVQSAAITATATTPNKIAVILADQAGPNNTHILLVHNGRADLIAGQRVLQTAGSVITDTAALGLPGWDGIPSTPLLEYDMTSGQTLGGFLLWAQSFFEANRTSFTYVGHGTAVAPAVDNLYSLFDNTLPPDTGDDNPFPLPSNQFANPSNQFANADYSTDTHFPLPSNQFANPSNQFANPDGVTDGAAIITPHALATALAIATDDGNNKLAVLDLVHCFAGTVEELYELHPYAEAMVASPNYAYFGDDLIIAAIQAPTPNLTPNELAMTIAQTYDATLTVADNLDLDPDVQHPRMIVAIDSDKMAGIKTAVDTFSTELYSDLMSDAPATKALIANAHQNSSKYDTTVCNADPSAAQAFYELNEHDALSDLHSFAEQFLGMALSAQANAVLTSVDDAILATFAEDGVPWFLNNAGIWTLDGRGIAIYGDFGGFADDTTTYLGWQTHWYNDGTNVVDNPHPLSFLQGGRWADVIAEFWSGQDVETIPCIPRTQGVIDDPFAPSPTALTLNHMATHSAVPSILILSALVFGLCCTFLLISRIRLNE